MSSLDIAEKWIEKFKKAGIDFKICNDGYHLKVDQWNFYPTKKSYWNELTGKKGYWKNEKEVKKLIESQAITPEELFNEIASNMMVRWDYEEFKQSHSHLHKVIIQSMKAWSKR